MRRVLPVLLSCGCSSMFAVGGQGMTAPSSGHSGEASVAAGGGVSGIDMRGEVDLGAATHGGVEGRVIVADEFAPGRDDCEHHPPDWQARIMLGTSFGAYQSPDLLFGGAAGVRWTVDCRVKDQTIRVSSIALDAIAMYAYRLQDRAPGYGDGGLFGLALTYRIDKRALYRWIPGGE